MREASLNTSKRPWSLRMYCAVGTTGNANWLEILYFAAMDSIATCCIFLIACVQATARPGHEKAGSKHELLLFVMRTMQSELELSRSP
jgi:hypothetical protein